MKKLVLLCVLVLTVLSLVQCASSDKLDRKNSRKSVSQGGQVNTTQQQARLQTSHLVNNTYENADASVRQDLSGIGDTLQRYLFEERIDPKPASVPITYIDTAELLLDQNNAVYRLGHSSVLLKLEGRIWLSDPVFSKRASFVQWLGPERFHPVPIDLKTLPKIEGVVISHDHYDHLDKHSIGLLHPKVSYFIVPLGLDEHLRDWGVPSEKIKALDWWESYNVNGITFTATPAQHFSGRGLFDTNQSLWASWAIKTPTHNLYFSGDSGYFDGFALIGERLGPFDLTMIETGAYDRNWSDIHMTPEQSVQAHIDLQGKIMMPVHNGTFDLALHSWYEPLVRVSSEAARRNVEIASPVMGQKFVIDGENLTKPWWQDVVSR